MASPSSGLNDFEEQLKQEAIEKQQVLKSGETTYTDKDGTEFEWDLEKRAWFPKIDANFIAAYQMSYGTSQPSAAEPATSGQQLTTAQQQQYADQQEDPNAAADYQWPDPNAPGYAEWYYSYYGYPEGQTAPAPEPDGTRVAEALEEYLNPGKQNPEEGPPDAEGSKGKKKGSKHKPLEPPKPPGWFSVEEKDNTTVYVSGLPSDVTDEEFKELMSKCGMVAMDPLMHRLKLKLYKGADGSYKGDGTCCYIKAESVALALQILDGYVLRDHTLHVEEAKFEMKGSYDPHKQKKKLTNKQKKKLKDRQKKLFDWRPDRLPGERPRHERTVVLKNVFTPQDLDRDVGLLSEMKEDLQQESAKHGEVKKITVHDRNPEGVATVMMNDVAEADALRNALNGRWFGGRRVTAETWDGQTKYHVEETAQEREKREAAWQEYLEKGGDGGGGASEAERSEDAAQDLGKEGEASSEPPDKRPKVEDE